MIAAEQRISGRGVRFDPDLVRSFIVAALGHDAAQDAVDELIFDHVVVGRHDPAAVAAALRPIVDEILDVAAREDWQAIADGLIADARMLEWAARPPKRLRAWLHAIRATFRRLRYRPSMRLARSKTWS